MRTRTLREDQDEREMPIGAHGVIIDTNVHLSRWPFRNLPGDQASELRIRLEKRRVRQAWAGSFDCILHRDLAGANARLTEECRKRGAGMLLPFGSVNPKLPDWREDLRRCHEDHGMPGIRLYPNYHGYTLDDAEFAELIKLAAARRLIVQLALSIEDERTQHHAMRVPPVEVTALPDLLKTQTGLRLVLLNWRPAMRSQETEGILASQGVYFDIASVEGVGGIARLVERIPVDRIVFGSHFPLFYFEAARLKMQESGLSQADQSRILEGNARRLLASASRA